MGADERTAYVASSNDPIIHDVAPDDVRVRIGDDYLLVGFLRDGQTHVEAGRLYVAGVTDRQRLENLLAIAARIRQATLDLIADLQGDDVAEVHTALGRPLPLPDAAPLHGTTTTAVPA